MRLLLPLAALALAASCAAEGRPSGATAAALPTPSATPAHAERREYVPDRVGGPGAFGQLELAFEPPALPGGYGVVRRSKKAVLDGDYRTEIDYAELRRGGRVVARFGDGAEEPHPEVRFGLFNFLGGPDEQLVVEQSGNRWWRYWVVRLGARPEVIYDSDTYELIWTLRAADLDGDGRAELSQHLGAFWFFDGLTNINSPRPPIVLAYDAGLGRYVPASARFREQLLGDIGERMSKLWDVKGRDLLSYRAGLLDIFLRHLYAGREREAWDFFEQECGGCLTLDQRGPLRFEIEEVLKGDPLYKELAGRAR